MGEDTQLEQLGKDGRWLESIALQLNHDEVVHPAIHTRRQIVETEIRVDRQTLGLGLVDEGDAVEVILKML